MPIPAGGLVLAGGGLVTGASAIWIDPTGAEWQLSNPAFGWFTLNDVAGLGATPIAITKDPDVSGGSTPRHIQPQSRIITWPLHIFGDDHDAFLYNYRQLARAFTRTRRDGAGILVIARPDGTAREIDAYYEAGFTNTPGRGLLDDDVVLSLYCPDGYWRDRTPATITREFATAASYLDPYPSVSSSQVLGATEADNPGEIEAWPSWSITGPASLITATNVDTGESWELDPDATGIAHGPLLGGETITITTRPPVVRGPAGEIWTAALNWPGAILWALEPGTTNVSFAVAGAGPGTTIELQFYPRYETE